MLPHSRQIFFSPSLGCCLNIAAVSGIALTDTPTHLNDHQTTGDSRLCQVDSYSSPVVDFVENDIVTVILWLLIPTPGSMLLFCDVLFIAHLQNCL